MKTFESTVAIESKLQDWAGVTFTVRRFTEGLRIQIRSRLADAIESLSEAVAEAEGIEAQSELGPKDKARLRTLADGIGLRARRVDRDYLRAALVKIDGLRIDGNEATANSLIETGPPDLCAEIIQAVRKEAGLSEQERKNSESPTISAEAEGGQTSATSAQPAEQTASMPIATATSITQSN